MRLDIYWNLYFRRNAVNLATVNGDAVTGSLASLFDGKEIVELEFYCCSTFSKLKTSFHREKNCILISRIVKGVEMNRFGYLISIISENM